MLPSHLLDPAKKKNERPSHTRLGGPPLAPLPSLCVTGAMSQMGRWCDVNDPSIVISYCCFRPRQLHDTTRPPLVVLHGGPSIPSNYLLPIVNGVTDRSIIFYDQWGCGKSSRPSHIRSSPGSPTPALPPFSIPTMVEHLRQLVSECWKLKTFHILGHSFGGILAFEYLKSMQQQNRQLNVSDSSMGICLSLLLASAPTSARVIECESRRLFRNLKYDGGGPIKYENNEDVQNGNEDEQDQPPSGEGNKKDDDDNSDDDEKDDLRHEEFRQTHECRLINTPLALMDALAQAGPTPWRGIPAIADYVAQMKDRNDDDDHDDATTEVASKDEAYIGSKLQIPTLLLRGEYDFCTEACMTGWTDLISDGTDTAALPQVILGNCSHYAMLEDERQFGKAVLDFLKSHDP